MDLEQDEIHARNDLVRNFTAFSNENVIKSGMAHAGQDVSMGAREALGNITNRLQNRVCLPNSSRFSKNLKRDKTPGILKNLNVLPSHQIHGQKCTSSQPRSSYHLDLNVDSGCFSDQYENSLGENSLRPNGLTQAKLVHSRPTQTKRIKFDTGHLGADTTKVDSGDEDGDVDRRPFKSKLACDIVRAAFADRVQLEELLAECRRADFAVSALDRTPVDRMMEATDYIVRIMAYEQMRENKECFRVSDFLHSGKQPNLTADMLTTLADWLVEVQENFALNHETIHLAWGLLYAYLDRGEALARREIQLMACAAIMVACKHEERQMPHLSEFLYITDNAYAPDEFIESERRLLVAIDFAVHRPNPYVFLRRYARVLDAHSGRVQFTSRFLLEAGMHSHAISLKRESRKAAAVLWLARVVLRNPAYSEWMKRSDVRQLRQFMKTNNKARVFYAQCYQCRGQKLSTSNSKVSNIGKASCQLTKPLQLNASIDSVTSTLPTLNASFSQGDSMLSSTFSNEPFLTNEDSGPFSRVDQSVTSDTSFFQSCHSTPSAFAKSKSAHHCNTSIIDYLSAGLDESIKADLEAMRLEEEQRQPLWPPILEHITGYKEIDLIPLALRYHTIAMRLIAEVARGGHLALQAETAQKVQRDNLPTDLSVHSVAQKNDGQTNKDELDNDAANARCVSPGGHYLRRQSVTKYCSSAFLSVADAYPQLAFDSFVPHFPSVQCAETCTCFVCTNLIRQNVQ